MDNTTGQGTSQKASWAAIDPTTLGQGFYSEKVEIDPGADSFVIAPPIPDGKYLATIQLSTDPQTPPLEGIHYAATTGRDGQQRDAKNVIRVNTELVVLQFANPELDNSVLQGRSKKFEKGFSTQIRKTATGNASEAVTLLNYLGVNVPAGTDAEVVAQALYQKLSSDPRPIVGVEIVWKAGFSKDKSNPKDFGSWAVVGMRNFPLLPTGLHSPIATVNGTEYHAKAYILRLFNPNA
jgi:hypothetical protein